MVENFGSEEKFAGSIQEFFPLTKGNSGSWT